MSYLSEKEKLLRQQSNWSVQGTLAMEGLQLDATSAEIGSRFDRGEISLAEFSADMQAHVADLAQMAKTKQRISSK